MAPPHKHRWKDWKEGKFCTVCGMPIVKASAEASSDCNHDWERHNWKRAKCLKCGYIARGSDYRGWFTKYGTWAVQYRPRCLRCREPTMTEGTVCENCSNAPEVIL